MVYLIRMINGLIILLRVSLVIFILMKINHSGVRSVKESVGLLGNIRSKCWDMDGQVLGIFGQTEWIIMEEQRFLLTNTANHIKECL